MPHSHEWTSGENKMNSFQLKDVTVKASEQEILSDISVSGKSGEIIGILGPNGAGKSTLLDTLCGLRKPVKGEITISGKSYLENSDYIKSQIGIVHEKPIQYEDLTPSEQLEFTGSLFGIKGSVLSERVKSLCSFFELTDFWHKPISALPKGIKQKLNIAAAIIHDPEILIMDEPTSALDPRSGRLIRMLVNRYRDSGRIVLLSTHILEIAETLCNRVIILQNGKIIEDGSPDKLRKDRSLEEVFLELTHGEEYSELIKYLGTNAAEMSSAE